MPQPLTMDSLRERMLGIGFVEHATDPSNQYFDKRVTGAAIGRFADPIRDFVDAFDDESVCCIDVVPEASIVQLYVPDLDHVESYPYGSPEAEELISLAAVATALR